MKRKRDNKGRYAQQPQPTRPDWQLLYLKASLFGTGLLSSISTTAIETFIDSQYDWYTANYANPLSKRELVANYIAQQIENEKPQPNGFPSLAEQLRTRIRLSNELAKS